MLLTKVFVAFLLIVLVQVIEGNNRVFDVTCDDRLVRVEDFHGSGSRNDRDTSSHDYCINGNCSYLFNHLAKDLSNDSVINITCDMELLSVVTIVGLTNISINGHNNPTVGCNGAGGLHFLSSNNVKIKGIVWEKCGFKNETGYANPVIKLDKSSTIVIQNCIFQQSVASAIMLIEISGDITINHCMFLNNTKYNGHGTAIYYLSKSLGSSTTKLLLSNSYFKGNEGGNSIIYLNSFEDATQDHHLTLENSTFVDNKNVIFYLVNQNVHINNAWFEEIKKDSGILHAGRSNIYINGNSESHSINSANNTVFAFLLDFSIMKFGGHSRILFNNSSGGTFALYNFSNLTFEDNCDVRFANIYSNDAIYSQNHSSVTFKGSSTALFSNNNFTDGGVISSTHYSSIAFQESSTVSFINNTATNGGAIHLLDHSSIVFEGNSTTSFNYNMATDNGGAIFSQHYSSVTFKGQSKAIFNYNMAENRGGALYLNGYCDAIFTGYSDVSFQYNEAYEGGAVCSKFYCSATFTGFSKVMFIENAATNAGALRGIGNSVVTFDESTEALFMRNHASNNGGAMDLHGNTDIVFKGNCYINYAKNVGLGHGGACVWFSKVSFMDNATINFTSNTADHGGAIALLDKYNAVFQNAQIIFSNNTASYGGAILCEYSDGGKLHFDMQEVGEISFYNNTALIWGNSMLIDDIPETCNKSCLIEELKSITYMDKKQQNELIQHITTAPYKIELQTQQITIICTDFEGVYNDCTEYHVHDVMLGQQLSLKGYVYDFLDNVIPRETQANIHSLIDANHSIHTLQSIYQDFDISIEGNEIISKYNYSMIITTFYYNYKYQRTDASVLLSVQLSPCYLGFQHNDASGRCGCYDRDDIVLCTGSSSSIKRGYWLGKVGEKLTTAICPINYCNFTCCETASGYHSLSPERENQCTSHRSGIACGSCEEGYTLSYAAECVSVNKCTVGWTVLTVTLTMLYWIVIVIGVFAMMYYKLPIGYLYAITYYYSMVDVLLGQYSYIYPSLHITINILSSVFKLDPQFLGQLCLVRGLSGIDIQFIQYIHPLAISIILVIISLLARCSQKLSLLIAKGIIHVICFLLLLSYTSMVSTSLLLLRSLQFYDLNNKVYTYLSPDIEYFHGRHLPYFIIAVICTITIIIGIPLILVLEPFLNSKINFTRIKPLLDQFQGCFKDQYRWFATYYKICRLVQIAIVVYSSDFLITQYILTIANVIVSIIHIIIRPYSNMCLNVFDGFILQLMVLVAVVPVFNAINSTIIVTVTFTLVILPLLVFLIVTLIIHKECVRNLIFTSSITKNNEMVMGTYNTRSVGDFDTFIDESMRRNAAVTVCDM